jgi:hypothetical protein
VKRRNKGTGRLSEKCKPQEMLGHGGSLHEDSGVYEGRDGAEVGLGKGEFLSHRQGDGD